MEDVKFVVRYGATLEKTAWSSARIRAKGPLSEVKAPEEEGGGGRGLEVEEVDARIFETSSASVPVLITSLTRFSKRDVHKCSRDTASK